MSQIVGLSQIESSLIESSVSHVHLSFDQDMFSNYLEPNQNDIFDTRRFSLQPQNSGKTNTATPKAPRSSTPGCTRSKITSQVNSARVITKSTFKFPHSKPRSHSKLTKRVENLEKKEELWRERASVWEKERKTYQKVLSSLETWKSTNFLKKVSEDLTNNPFQELKNIFEWISSQPDSVPFKSIKLSFSTISHKLHEIEDLITAPTLNTAVQELSTQNQKLSSHLSEIEEMLQSKSADLLKLSNEIKNMQQMLNEKEECIQRLSIKLEDDAEGFDHDFVVKLESELEAKSYELLMISTENKRLASDLQHSNKSNEFYIKTIEELKEKLKTARQESGFREKEGTRTLVKTPRSCESATQTAPITRIPRKKPEKRGAGYSDFLNFTTCMASALEALLDSPPT